MILIGLRAQPGMIFIAGRCSTHQPPELHIISDDISEPVVSGEGKIAIWIRLSPIRCRWCCRKPLPPRALCQKVLPLTSARLLTDFRLVRHAKVMDSQTGAAWHYDRHGPADCSSPVFVLAAVARIIQVFPATVPNGMVDW